MKTKKLFLCLAAGAFLCFSNASYAQFHSSGGSDGSGGGAFGDGANIITVGLGFGGGLGSYSLPGYSTSSGIGYNISYEHGLSNHWGIGLTISYSSSSLTYNQSTLSDSFNYNTGQVVEYNTTVSDKYTLSVLGFTVRGYYHFATSAKFDPYVGIGLGYMSVSSKFTQTVTPPSAGGDYAAPGIGIGTTAGGAFVGARYYFSDHIGVWLELQWQGYAGNIANLGLAFKL